MLREAKDDPDIEVSRRVRYLLHRLDVVWYQNTDSPNVKSILEKYSSLSKIDRATRIDALASLPIEEGIPVLCRIARLETEDRLSKRAAVALIKAKYFRESPEKRKRIASQIQKVTRQGKRKSMVWLRTFAESLPDPKAFVDRWREIVALERKNYANYPATSSNQILLRLVRFETETLLLVDDREAAIDSAQQAGELVEDKRQDLLTHVDWLLDRKFPELVAKFAALHAAAFQEGLGLRYRLAEGQRGAGAEEKAVKTAESALKHRIDDFAAHLEVANQLESRGMQDWAEAEYRFVAEGEGENLIFSYRARVGLSEMLHDQFNDFGSSTVLQSIFDEIDNDPKKLAVFRQYRPSDNMIRSRMYYFYFLLHEQKKDVERQKKALEDGYRAYPDDVDLLIGIYRFSQSQDDESYKTLAKQRLATSGQRLLDTARRYDNPNQNPKSTGNVNYLAHYNNQYAWLVANTIGDYDEALRRCREAVDLMPDASGYWDTLGRCYFAKKDYVNAVKFQEHAVSMEPHSGLIKRQLEIFHEALAKQQAENAPKEAKKEAEDES